MLAVRNSYPTRAATGISRYQAQLPTRLCRAMEYTNRSKISDAPKYLVSSQAAINKADASRKSGRCGPSPSIQRIAAHIQSASIIGSHITLQAETNKPGVRRVEREGRREEGGNSSVNGKGRGTAEGEGAGRP